jgi:rare lipoprotein A (peptidoglycan hydrolase)
MIAKDPCLKILLFLLLAATVALGLALDTPGPRPKADKKGLDLAILTMERADATLDRAKEIEEQAWILLEKTEASLWSIRLSEANRNVCVSWYGEPYHGRLAASGIAFDMNSRHVAHRWLPFGTRVMFYNPLNGTMSYGIIVDRGPFIDGRAFDLSYFMAEELGVVESGVAIVRCWVTELPGEMCAGRPSEED